MDKNNKQLAEKIRSETLDIEVFMQSYGPNICKRLYKMYEFEGLEAFLNAICLSHEEGRLDDALEKIKGCFRAANSRYPLDLRVYEDTKTGKHSIVNFFVAAMCNQLNKVEKMSMTPVDSALAEKEDR